MAKVKVKTSAVVNRQVPEFVRVLDAVNPDGGSFIKFLEAYYEWLDQNYKTRELDKIGDIDETLEEYVEYFAEQFLQSVPRALVVDKRIIVKHAKELYLAKGTPKSYDLLFRMMFNESPQQIYFPKVDMLRVSDGNWSQSFILRGVDVQGDAFELIGQTVVQESTGIGDDPASARVEAVVKYNVGTQSITEITLNNNSIIGVFEPNQPIKGLSNSTNAEIIVDLIPFINQLKITQPGKYFTTGDLITIAEGDGTNARAEVGAVKSGGISSVVVLDGGDTHFVGQPVLFDNTNTGFGNSSEVQGAVAEVASVDFGCFLLESAVRWKPSTSFSTGAKIIYKENEYLVTAQGTTGALPPTHIFGSALNGTISLRHIGTSSFKLVNEDSSEISLERTRVYKTDQFGNYDENIPSSINDGFGSVRSVKIINPGSSYNTLPKVNLSTDIIQDIRTEAGTNIITIQTQQLHELIFGQSVTITGTIGRISDGTYAVNSIIDPFTFTIRGKQIFGSSGTLGDRNLKQVLYADRTFNPNTIRTYSNAKLYAVSEDVGSISSLVLPNFGYYYNTVRLTTPVFLQVERPLGNFTTGEQINIVSQSFCTERTEDELLLETGERLLFEKQQTSVGVVDSYSSETGLLRLSPASNRNGLLLENGLPLLDEEDSFLVHEASGVFNKRNFIVGSISGARTRIVDSASGGVRGEIGAIGLTTGEFLNADGFISEGSKRIQDSFYYQDYSYVIRIGQSVNKYRDAVKKLLHPVGLALFGEVSLINLVQALTRIMNDSTSIVMNQIVLDDLRAKVLAVGNWQEPTNRMLIDNSDRYTTLSMEGGFRDVIVTEEGNRLVFEDGNVIVSERTAIDGRTLLLETGDKITTEEQRTKFFDEYILQEFFQFFRLENDSTHTKSRNPFVRKEQWTLNFEDFVPSYSDSDTLKLENARVDGNGVVIDDGNDLLLEDGGRFLNQLQLSKPAPSMRVLQSEMLPPIIIDESDANTVRLLEMSPQALKEFVFRIKSKVSMSYPELFLLLEDGSYLLTEDNSKFGIDSKYPRTPNEKSERNLYVESVPSNVELDNLLLETGDFILSEDTYPSGNTFVATIEAALAGSMTLFGSSPKFSLSSEPITGMDVIEGFALPFTQRVNFGEGVLEEVDYRQEVVTFTIKLSNPLPQTIETTPLVSLSFKTASSKLVKDDQTQHLFRSNFSTASVSYKDTNVLGKATIQSRASFRQLGGALSFLEQRKFNFAPYTVGSKGSLQVVPGNVYVGVLWLAETVVLTKEVVNYNGNAYEVVVAGTTGTTEPTHTSGTVLNGTAELRYIGPTKKDVSYLPDTEDGGFTGGWYEQYPAPNRSYWNNEYIEMENGSRLLSETGDEQILEVMGSSGDTQIKDFANVSVYDIINRKNKRTNFAVGAYVEVLKTA